MIVLYLVLLAVTIIYWLIKQKYSYWTRRNFPTDPETHFPFGNLKTVVHHEQSMGVAMYDAYLRSPNLPFVGIYLLFRPGVLIRDPELARQVLVQDFNSFYDRGIYVDEERDPLSCTLFGLRYKSWRSLRHKLAPTFSPCKIKAMLDTSEDVGNKMVAFLNKTLPESGSMELDVKDVFITYSIDTIGSVIFGLDVNSYNDPQNKFRCIVHSARQNNFIAANIGMLNFFCPSFVKFLVQLGLRNQTAIGMHEIMKEAVEYREKHNIIRKDMMEILMQLRNTGKTSEDGKDCNTKPKEAIGDLKEFTLEHIAAQGVIFYIAGQEATSTLMAFTIYELAQFPEVLTRAQKEVDEVLMRHQGQLSYEALREMSYLELCLQETNRKYPLPFLNRECTQDYTIPGTKHVIEKGTPIVIPLLGIHRDEKYFPNPMTFDPDRFTPSSPNYRANTNAYTPYGAGPRQCVGWRMGMIIAKLGIVKILQNFNIELMSKREIVMDNYSVAIQPKDGIKVRLSKKVQVG